MRQVIPIFPLDYVLLPGVPLPLHIFEPRYRQLVADVCSGGKGGAFGVVLGTSASAGALSAPATPVGSGRTAAHAVSAVGTLAEILENEAYDDGRSDLLTVGSKRFRIYEVDDATKPYLQAEVEFMDEKDGAVDPAVLKLARRLTLRYGQALGALTGSEYGEEISTDPLRASYEIATRMQLLGEERQSLLAASDAATRLSTEVELLRRELAILRVTRAVPVPAQALYVASSRS